jgi:uncharacterized membrane protein YphA (DoxX/SURF4 family)
MSEATDNAGRRNLDPVVVGVKPWLPWPLSRWRWFTEPVPAERLAGLRIGIAALLLLDILFTYLPYANVLFGGESLGRPEIFRFLYRPEWSWKAVEEDVTHLGEDLAKADPFHRTLDRRWRWSLLRDVEEPRVIRASLIAWLVATAFLLLGLGTRAAAAVVWLLSTSFANVNTYVDNGGDQIRYIVTLYLLLTPCGAAWSLDAWLRRRRGRLPGRVFVYPWALRLLFVQMVLMYWCNGWYKWTGEDWTNGDSLYYVLGDLTLTRWSYSQFPIPYEITRISSWMVLAWELTFPLWVCLPWRWLAGRLNRSFGGRLRWLTGTIRCVPVIALSFGVVFHLGIGASMELGFFVPYALCLYLPLLPLERLSRHVSTVSAGASTLAKSA